VRRSTPPRTPSHSHLPKCDRTFLDNFPHRTGVLPRAWSSTTEKDLSFENPNAPRSTSLSATIVFHLQPLVRIEARFGIHSRLRRPLARGRERRKGHGRFKLGDTFPSKGVKVDMEIEACQQPALTEPASRPTSASEVPKRGVDSALKEIERANTDAESAKASAATARKLANVEAALQRTKEDAERDTSEAQRAKAGAQAARESEAAAKRKLADAEAARTAAEARCQSAAKNQPSLGARLRGWILQHYP